MNNILPKTATELNPGETKLPDDAPEPEGAHDVQMSDAKEVSKDNISKRASREIPDQNFAEEVTVGNREDDPQIKVRWICTCRACQTYIRSSSCLDFATWASSRADSKLFGRSRRRTKHKAAKTTTMRHKSAISMSRRRRHIRSL